MTPEQRTALRTYLIARLSETSTWRGIVLVITAMGVHVAPENVESIIAMGIGIAGVLGAVFPDSGRKP